MPARHRRSAWNWPPYWIIWYVTHADLGRDLSRNVCQVTQWHFCQFMSRPFTFLMPPMLANYISRNTRMTGKSTNQRGKLWQKGRGKGVPVVLGCRRGGSHSKATAVVCISVLISPDKGAITLNTPWNWHTFALRFFSTFFPVELVLGPWNDGVCREFELTRR